VKSNSEQRGDSDPDPFFYELLFHRNLGSWTATTARAETGSRICVHGTQFESSGDYQHNQRVRGIFAIIVLLLPRFGITLAAPICLEAVVSPVIL